LTYARYFSHVSVLSAQPRLFRPRAVGWRGLRTQRELTGFAEAQNIEC
jgi:hypothetical protein